MQASYFRFLKRGDIHRGMHMCEFTFVLLNSFHYRYITIYSSGWKKLRILIPHYKKFSIPILIQKLMFFYDEVYQNDLKFYLEKTD